MHCKLIPLLFVLFLVQRASGQDFGGTGAAGIFTSLASAKINGDIYIDGCANPAPANPVYTCDYNGLSAAIAAALASGNVVRIPPGILPLGNNTITMSTNLRVYGAGMWQTALTYTGSGTIIDYPANTNSTELEDLSLEPQTNSPILVGISIEGNSTTGATYWNTVRNVNIGNTTLNSGQVGLHFNPSPSGINGAPYIFNNRFLNVVFGRWARPIYNQGDTQDTIQATFEDASASGNVAYGDFTSDKLDFTINLPSFAAGVTGLNLPNAGDSNNLVSIQFNDYATGGACVSSAGRGNIIQCVGTEDSSLAQVGSANPSSGDTYIYADALGHVLPVYPYVTYSNLPSSPPNGTLIICTNCTSANPCASGGRGALAKRIGGAWVCN